MADDKESLVSSKTVEDRRPSKATPVEAADAQKEESVTQRPNDLKREQPPAALANTSFADRQKARKSGEPVRPTSEPIADGKSSTFADRAKARRASEKRVASASNKAVSRSDVDSK